MKKHTLIAVIAAALLAPAVKAADVTEADLQKAMKDVQAGVGAIRGSNGDVAAAATAAKSVEAALASVEGFWKARKDDAAVKMSADSRAAALAIAKAADATAQGEATRAMFGTCKACHDVHREQLPDKSYKLK